MDRLHSMRVFARVIDEGSFARAAREMNLSAAVVTRLVADLEAHLGARLINRTTRRLALTDTGELYLERVRQILSEVEEAEAQASAATSEPRGHLRVLVPPAFAVHQLAKHLPAFRRACPLVTLELSVPGVVETVDENHDVTIITSTHQVLDGDFAARRLAKSEVVMCAAPAYLNVHGRPAHPNDLLGHEAMIPREATFHRYRPSGTSNEDKVTLIPHRPALNAVHIDTMHASALAGLGVVPLPSYVAEDALLENALERVLPEWCLQPSTIHAAMPTRKYVPARTRAFIDFLVATFGGEDKDPWLAAAAGADRQ